MSFNIHIILDNLPEILSGLWLTILMWLVGSLFGMIAGFLLSLMQRIRSYPLQLVISAYQTVFRGTPFLIQLFVIYYGGPSVGILLEPVTAGIIGLVLYSSAYFAEIFKAGFTSVNIGQVEAGRVCGLSEVQIITRIQLPQMMLTILPSLISMMIVLSKETAILSVITVPELTAVLSGIGSATFTYVETLLVLLLVYWGIVAASTYVGHYAESRLSRYTLPRVKGNTQ